MPWDVEFDSEFEAEFGDLPIGVQNDLYARAAVLEQFGPALGRPAVDSLKGSRHPNMKELRFNSAGGVWRVAFAFDRSRRAVLLAAGDKSGISERLFYRRLLRKADGRFDQY